MASVLSGRAVGEAVLLVRGDESGFMSRVSQTVFPQRPKPPKPAKPPKPSNRPDLAKADGASKKQ
jgi:hypothetical protein